MDKGPLLVVGAAGDVGQGIVEAALNSGRSVVAAGRTPAKLERMAARLGASSLACVTGDLASEVGASALWSEAVQAFGGVESVVISVNAVTHVQRLTDWSAKDLSAVHHANVLTHLIAAKVFLPLMPESGLFIGIGGGTADFILPGMAHISMGQAALRMLYRGLAKERKTGAQPRELMIVSMVAGQSNRETAQPDWLTDVEIGRHICAILDSPEKFPKPVLQLRSKKQVGQPEAEA